METSFFVRTMGCYKKEKRKFYFWGGSLEVEMLASVDSGYK